MIMEKRRMSIQKFLRLSAVAFVLSALVISCDDDDNNNNDEDPVLTGESKTYVLNSVSDSTISGTVKFEERSDNATVVTISLNGTTGGNSHPAYIYANSVAEDGDIIIDLNSVTGADGTSETVIDERNDGTSITYDELLDINGHVIVHLSQAQMDSVIAEGDIGENELTNTTTTYVLEEVDGSGVTGEVIVTRRVNGNSLIMVDLDGLSPAGEYPVYIYDNDVETTGPIAIDLNSVSGAMGRSFTSVSQLNNGTAITYDQLRTFNGHIGVNASATDSTFVASGNVGSNVVQP